MKISIEISLYPLKDQYETVIIDFIKNLNTYDNLEIETNGMSTQVFGEYNDVMNALQIEMKKVYESQQAILIMKMGKGVLK